MSVGAERPRERPKPFADEWTSPGTPRPPTTVANALGSAGRIETAPIAQTSIGARFRRYTAEELAAVPSVDATGGIDLSPDGSEVAFAWDRSGALEIYSAPLVGDRIIQLTEDGGVSRAPRWSPDARWIAFLRRDAGGDSIWLVDRDGERARRLTPEAGYRDHAWSPDGRAIAASTSNGALVVVDVPTGEVRRVASGSQPRWSPDGTWILFTSGDDLALAPATGGAGRALATRGDGRGRSSDGRWSFDGSLIAFTTTARGHREVAFAHVRDAAVARIERLGATPFEDGEPVWRPDGRGVIYRRANGGNVSLRRAFTVSHADEAAADVPGVHSSAQVAPDSETIVAVLSQATRPADVIVRGKGAIGIARVTSSLPGTVDPVALVEPTTVRYGDGRTALVYVPHAEAGAVGEVVHYARAALREWDPPAQLLAANGHVVLVSGDEDPSGALAGTPFSGRRVRRVEMPAGVTYASRADRTAALEAIVSGVRSG